MSQKDAPAKATSPPFGAMDSSNGLQAGQTGASSQTGTTSVPAAAHRYHVSAHSVRVTKHGYTIEPVELRYPEVSKRIPVRERRTSNARFDSRSVANQVLNLIRGFWSQPGFPFGRQMRSTKRVTVKSMLRGFSANSLYPHLDTQVDLCTSSPEAHSSAAARPRAAPPTSAGNAAALAGQHRDHRPMASPPPSPSSSSKAAPASQTGAERLKEAPPTGSASGKPRKPDSLIDDASMVSLILASAKGAPPRLRAPKSRSTYFSWIPKDREQICDLISELCEQLESLFAIEDRIIKVASPCFVLGDIHGNLSDLRTYERSLWPKAPACLTSNYLFLGDYVDRGDFSVECVLYLFAMKLLSPARFFLLRGNHEIAAIQRQYTFARECEDKFGQLGRQLWRKFNRVFDVMPIAAIVDEEIFCAHGGIPRSVTQVRPLTKTIPTPLDQPEVQCPAAWEILWNDPITDSELISMIEMDNSFVAATLAPAQTAPPPPPPPIQAAKASAAKSSAPSASSAAVDAAHSFYIKSSPNGQAPGAHPAASSAKKQPPPEEPASQLLSGKLSAAASAQQAADSRQEERESDALRTFPSDTSSIASTSAQQLIEDGFVANIKRGTAYLFSDQAIENFLKANKFSHIIRAHEVIPTGFAFHGDGRVITIFSSSKYCGLNNQAACALVDRGQIRILRLDTGELGE